MGGLQPTGAARRVTVKPSSNECFEMADVRKRKECSREKISTGCRMTQLSAGFVAAAAAEEEAG